jgi:hypothetical protein
MKLKSKKMKSALLMFLLILSLPGITIMSIGCASSAEYIPEKLETPLHQRILYLEKEEPDILIQFAGKSNTSINDEMKKKLESAGLLIETIIRDIFTASGNAESIKKTTLLDFVVFLEIAKKLDIK